MKINYKTQTLFPCGVEDYTLTFIVPTHKTLIKYQIYSLDSKIVTLYSKLINGIITLYPPVIFLYFGLPTCGFIFDTLLTCDSLCDSSITHLQCRHYSNT